MHFGNACLSLCTAGLCDGGSAVEVQQRLEPGQSFEVLQAGVADRGVVEAQRFELGQSLEVFQPGVANLGLVRGSGRSLVNPSSCLSPALLTLVPASVQARGAGSIP